MSAGPVRFPTDFLWGTATSSHQVDGGNVHSDWWDWEHDPSARFRIAEPSGEACDHRHRYPADIALMAELGLNAYRFSVEWARIEPRIGEFDENELARVEAMVDACGRHGLTPIVTLQHFTLPRWVSRAGSWTDPYLPGLFERYARRVLERIGDRVGYVATFNEPGNMLVRGYLGTFPSPPFVRDLAAYWTAVRGLLEAHRRSRAAVREIAPDAKVGMAHALQDWRANPGGQPAMEFTRTLHEDAFFAVVPDDDFLGVQTYTRLDVRAPAVAGPLTRTLLRSDRLTSAVLLPVLRRSAQQVENPNGRPAGVRRTQLGWIWAPEAVADTARRVAALFPDKELLVSEHGIATDDDTERIEFLTEGLRAVHSLIADGFRVSGYLHWSFIDNWEWWHGYRPKFGLVAVDRTTQERTVKPSARWYGRIAASGRLE